MEVDLIFYTAYSALLGGGGGISMGIYGYPKEAATRVAIGAVRAFTAQHWERVVFVCFDRVNYEWYRKLL